MLLFSPIVVGKQSDKYMGAILFSILSNKLSFLDFRRSSNFEHPVSKYKLNLRNNDDYRTQRYGLQTSSKSFFPSTIKLWNSLPDSVKSLPTFYKLKKKHSACPNSGGFILQYWR
jgi:hypothetical protein